MKLAPQELWMKQGGRLLLREAQGTDAGAVLAYLNRVGGESDNLLFGKDGFPLPVEREASFLEGQRQEARSILVLGFAGEELVCVASCDALTARERVAHRASVSLTVARDYWGQGIGRGVMEALIAFARQAGLEVLQLEVRADNTRAVALYEHLGFEKLGLYRNFMKVNGQGFDAWYMNLYLDGPVLLPVKEEDLEACLSVIHGAFATVAEEFSLTRENCPTHTSFLPFERLRQAWEEKQSMACFKESGRVVGYVAVAPQKDGSFEVKHLAVLPEYRHRGYGERLVAWAEAQARQEGAALLKIGIIEESTVLKAWYQKLGFQETGTHKFPHLPFTVGFMEKAIQ